MGQFLYAVIDGILGLLELVIIANAILSWLVAFDVVNYRNRFVGGIGRTLDVITRPVLWPFQKVIPPLGGIDVTPIIALIIIHAARQYLLPWIFQPIVNLLGG